jgi:hypothetical protein
MVDHHHQPLSSPTVLLVLLLFITSCFLRISSANENEIRVSLDSNGETNAYEYSEGSDL